LLLAGSLLASADDITPRVGDIEIYGVRKVSVQKVRNALGVNAGDPLPSREATEERIDKLSGILASRVEAACCTGRAATLYVGVEERDEPHVEYHPAPTGDIALPPSLFDSYREFLDDVAGSIRGRNADEDLTNGYSLMADPDCRQLQQSFIAKVAQDLPTVDKVVRESSDGEQRAAAAYLLQYGPRGGRTTPQIVDGLQWALRDQEDNVRENAMRSLRAIIVSAKLHPEQEIRIEPTWYVELLNSVVWSDRRNATLALVDLTQDHNPQTLELLRQRALPSVVEMARWHEMRYALPAFILAGRLAGLDEKGIQEAWVDGNRDAVLAKASHSARKHSHTAD
jgi:hypothetical protein